MKRFFLIMQIIQMVSFLVCSACRNTSPEHAKQRAHLAIEALIDGLQSIDDEEDLIEREQVIEGLFQRLVDCIIEARKRELETNSSSSLSLEDEQRSIQLKSELNRIYRMERGKEWMEKIQSIAVERLNRFENKRTREFHKKSNEVWATPYPH